MTPLGVEAPTSLDTLALEIMAAHRAALGASASALDHGRHAGDLLIQAKKQLRHGEWLRWVSANCDLSIRMMQVYMQIARGWSRLEELRNAYPDTYLHLDITAARQLLANGADDAEDNEEDDDVSEDDLGGGGCDGANDSDSGDDHDTGCGCDEQMRRVYLFFTVASRRVFLEQIDALTAVLGIHGNLTDRIAAVVAREYDHVVRRKDTAA